MRVILKIGIFFAVVSLILALAYREVLIREYPPDIRRYQSYIKDILTEEYKVKFINQYPEFNGSYSKSPQFLLSWLGERVQYTKDEITRHDDPIDIIEYGWGRCHEFSLAYMALLYVQGFTSRLILDVSPQNNATVAVEGDHIWIEYNLYYTWQHIDPTEGAVWTQTSETYHDNPYVNNPLMYERDWEKDLTEVWGIAPNMCERVEENYQYEI